jgi:hypothetical protein
MKPSKSKLALAKVIDENGGWVDGAKFSSQNKEGNVVCFYSNSKPTNPSRGELKWKSPIGTGYMGDCDISASSLITNWHQTILSREEYYRAYPEVTKQDAIGLAEAINMIDGGDNPKADADGWIEWNGLNIAPVKNGVEIDIRFRDGDVSTVFNPAFMRWSHHESASDITAYRPRNPEINPEFCESVTRSIPEPNDFELECDPSLVKLSNGSIGSESIDELCAKVTEENKHQHIDAKPTIEQLAHDYRNAKDYADRLQKEAGEAAVKAEELAVEIRKKILELQELIG